MHRPRNAFPFETSSLALRYSSDETWRMAKLLVIVIIAAIAVWYFRRHLAPPAAQQEQHASSSETTMVRCAQCNLFLPPANATPRGGRWYCEKHR